MITCNKCKQEIEDADSADGCEDLQCPLMGNGHYLFNRSDDEKEIDRLKTEVQSLTSRNAELEGFLLALGTALVLARDKLKIYREHSDGIYQGGMEYEMLMGVINNAIKIADRELSALSNQSGGEGNE